MLPTESLSVSTSTAARICSAVATFTKESSMRISNTTRIEAPAEQVWAILSEQFDDVMAWSTDVSESAADPSAPVPTGASMGGRICTTTVGVIEERITSYSNDQMQMTFKINGMPSFVREAASTMAVRPIGPNSCDTSLTADMDMNAIGKLMAPVFKMKLGSLGKRVLDDLKVYAESGKPSESKEKQLAKGRK